MKAVLTWESPQKIIVGKNREVGKVLDSRIWVHRLKQKIVEAKDKGEAVWLTIGNLSK